MAAAPKPSNRKTATARAVKQITDAPMPVSTKPLAKSFAPANSPADKAGPKLPAADTAAAKKAAAKKAPAKKAPAKKVPGDHPAAKKAAAKKVPPHKHAPHVEEPKPPKAKLVRDSFTMPKTEYAVIDEIKSRTARLGRSAKKSEVLRAGVKLLAALQDESLLAAFAVLPQIKTGRPGKG